jgi:hypothetical protein
VRARKTFREILEAAAEANSHCVAERARLASRTAKCARDIASKRLAYGVKHKALQHGVARFPERFALSGLELDGRLARIQYGEQACFHLPMSDCSAPTREWIDGERARILTAWSRVRSAA